MSFCTFQLHGISSNLNTTQDMYKFIDQMAMAYKGSPVELPLFLNLLGRRAACVFTIWGNTLQSQ